MMTFQEYQQRTNRAIPDHTSQKDEILHWCIGLSEEVGETLSVIKHHYYGGEPFNRADLVKEIGDVLWYTAALCRACNVDMEGIAELNCRKLEHRFPDKEFDDERSVHRHELEKKFSETDEYAELLQRCML